ncbi:MAG: AsnC family transcriptional regulator [Thermofilum sp. ex4484_15]|nr:MAG: AsnC family transcriptional regulator [Thermofilum sp. ex4484_15]
MPSISLDELDLKIIASLSENSRIPITALSEMIGVPRTTVASRIEKLRKLGVIEGYTLKLNYRLLGYNYLAFILIKARRGKGISNQISLAKRIKRDSEKGKGFPWVQEAHVITGDYDILLKVRIREWDELTNFLIRYLARLEEVEHSLTLLTLTTVYEENNKLEFP